MDLAQCLLEEDVQSPEYLAGAARGLWGRIEADWPHGLFWLSVPARANSPDRFHLLIDLTGYRDQAPTGTLVNAQTREKLELSSWPKGRDGSRFAKVFRTDWEGRRALYHPFDRFAFNSHTNWATEMPHKIWTPDHTIVDYLEEWHALFHSEDYLGV